MQITPTYKIELNYLKTLRFVAGVDEVGVGPLAGPVVAAAVILNPKRVGTLRSKNKWWYGVRDSKMLSHEKREKLVHLIFKNCLTFGLGMASAAEIDRLNILQARMISMKRAIESMKVKPEFVLVDGHIKIPAILQEQKCVIAGDAKILSIACASIVAKVTRDNILKRLHENYPQYGFNQHKGYPTKLHQEKLKEHGPCPEHRKTFGIVKSLLFLDA